MRGEECQKQGTCVVCCAHTHIRASANARDVSALFQADMWEVSGRRRRWLQPPSRGCGALNTWVISTGSAVNAPETKNGKDFMKTFPNWLHVGKITFWVSGAK